MGQSQSNNNNQPLTGRGLHAQGTLGRSLKRVYSESSGERRCATSLSLPASPAVLKRLEPSGSATTPSTTVSTANDSESLASSSASSTAKMPLTLESVLKNFEEFAQHQWPTWAKRRGWIAEFPDASQPQEADDSGRVVQLDKDKWVFQRRRKKTELPPIDLNSGTDRLATGRPLLEEENATDLTEKMVEILQIDETKTAGGSGTGGGQRSRRSSGYASASNSPVTKRAADQTGVVSSASPTVVISNGDASAGQCDDWQMGRMSLYEVTLRWMFDADVDVAEDEQGRSWMDSPLKRIASSITDDDEPIDSQVVANEMKAPTAAVSSANVQDERIVRIYFHLFSRRGSHAVLNPLPSHIDFIEIPANPDDGGDDGSRAATFSSQPHHVYAPVVSHTHPPAFLPRETTCAELIRQILGLHPQLECAADKMALYEKTWQSGKTSRARLRRLNDTECPFILAKQWVNASQEESACAKSLVFQETQNGDIPWEEFSLAELTSFLRVLDREEANHELEIREKYQRISQKMRDTMQRLSPAESVHQQQQPIP